MTLRPTRIFALACVTVALVACKTVQLDDDASANAGLTTSGAGTGSNAGNEMAL